MSELELIMSSHLIEKTLKLRGTDNMLKEILDTGHSQVYLTSKSHYFLYFSDAKFHTT